MLSNASLTVHGDALKLRLTLSLMITDGINIERCLLKDVLISTE